MRGPSVPRLAVLWCPHWPVVVAGAGAHEAVAVLRAERVVARSPAAAEHGIAIGQRRREAQARCPHLRLEPYDPERDARVFERVVQAVAAIVPRLEVSEPGTLTFLAKGPARYFGGEFAMAQLVVRTALDAVCGSVVGNESLPVFGLGVADGRFAAGVAARGAVRERQPVVVPPGVAATAEYLHHGSLRLLSSVAGVSEQLVQLLQRLGMQRLGDVALLPEVDVAARFGPEGSFAHRLASGGDDRLPGTTDAPAGLDVERTFEPPVYHSDALVFTGRQMADDLAGVLAADGCVCTRLVIVAETEQGERSERVWQRSTGFSAAAMLERLRWQLDAWAQRHDLTSGVVSLRLEPAEIRADDGVQLGLWGGRTQADEWAVRAVSRLVAVAGEQHVLVPAAAGGRQPHDSFRWVPAATADLLEPAERMQLPPGPWPGRLPTPSPALVHEPPLEIGVIDADRRPVRVSGRGAVSAAPAAITWPDLPGGRPERIASWAGPWPLEERWWDAARARRSARFQLLTESGRLLLVALEQQSWWLLASYD